MFVTTAADPSRARLVEKRREHVFLLLSGLFLGTLAMLNILGVTRFLDLSFRLPLIGVEVPMLLAVGVLPYPITFLCTDFLSEFYGHRRANTVVLVGLLINLWVMFFLWLGGVLPGVAGEANGEVFILGGEGYVTLNQWVAEVAKVVDGRIPRLHVPLAPVMLAAVLCEIACRPLGIEPPLYRRRVELFSKDRAADISKAKRVLGYRPEVSLADGLRRTANWYQEQGLL